VSAPLIALYAVVGALVLGARIGEVAWRHHTAGTKFDAVDGVACLAFACAWPIIAVAALIRDTARRLQRRSAP
jgi:hypothetical protein